MFCSFKIWTYHVHVLTPRCRQSESVNLVPVGICGHLQDFRDRVHLNQLLSHGLCVSRVFYKGGSHLQIAPCVVGNGCWDSHTVTDCWLCSIVGELSSLGRFHKQSRKAAVPAAVSRHMYCTGEGDILKTGEGGSAHIWVKLRSVTAREAWSGLCSEQYQYQYYPLPRPLQSRV